MTVKYWGFAGLLLTYWCNARCRCCYVCSRPEAGTDMSVEQGLMLWEGLIQASPHGCRVHIGGGEPFGRWETLIDLARQARQAHLGPLEAVETNGFWAADEAIVRDRLAQLDEAGMGRISISCDPYHQEFVPLSYVRRLAGLGREILGPDRVRVRWEDWEQSGCEVAQLDEPSRRKLLADYAALGRDRLCGRGAVELTEFMPSKELASFTGIRCSEPLLRSRHVHVDGQGEICPGTCAGIVLGTARTAAEVATIWQRLDRGYDDMDVIGTLARSGPAGLAALALARGYKERSAGYAGKCHVCWDVRRWLFEKGHWPDQLGPASVYQA